MDTATQPTDLDQYRPLPLRKPLSIHERFAVIVFGTMVMSTAALAMTSLFTAHQIEVAPATGLSETAL